MMINYRVMDSSVLEVRDFESQGPGFEPHQNDLEQLMNPELPPVLFVSHHKKITKKILNG